MYDHSKSLYWTLFLPNCPYELLRKIMMKDIYFKKKLVSSWFSLLQQTICYEFEKIEIDFGKQTKQKPKYFEKKNWKKSGTKNEGGGTQEIN